MTQNPTNHTNPAGAVPTGSATPQAPPLRAGGGFGILPFTVEKTPSTPATDASWGWSLRRFARGAVWLLPGYALLYGLVALFAPANVGAAPYPARGNPVFLLGWVAAVWLGVLALMALASLLVTSRSRRMITAALLVALAGTVLMLPFVGLPGRTPVYGVDARILALTGGSVYTVGWLLAGWALIRSGVFSYADGGLLMASAPLLGVGGLLVGALQAYGALLALAGGIGVAWRSGRLAPQTAEATTVHSAPGTVAARAAADGTLAA